VLKLEVTDWNKILILNPNLLISLEKKAKEYFATNRNI
jgi:hypothetical protein